MHCSLVPLCLSLISSLIKVFSCCFRQFVFHLNGFGGLKNSMWLFGGGGRVVLDKVGRLTAIAWAVWNCIKCLKRGRENNLKKEIRLGKWMSALKWEGDCAPRTNYGKCLCVWVFLGGGGGGWGADRGLRGLLKVSCKTKWPAAAIIFLAQFLVFALFYLS